MFAERHLPALQDNLSSLEQRFTRYVGDISKGIAILIIAGLAASMVLCLVRCCSKCMTDIGNAGANHLLQLSKSCETHVQWLLHFDSGLQNVNRLNWMQVCARRCGCF